MILEPSFFTHPKTVIFCRRLDNDPTAPLYLIRLWCFCQTQRTTLHSLSSEALKIVCDYSGNANRLESALIASGFVRRDGEQVEVLNWAKHNCKMANSWKNGGNGGRPKSSPKTQQEKNTKPARAKNDSPAQEEKKPQKTQEKTEVETPRKPKTEKGELGSLRKGKGSMSGCEPDVVDAGDSDDSPIVFVIHHYQRYHPRSFPAIHDGLREWRLIRDRLEKDGFSAIELCDAIDGCHVSPHHCGQNERGTKYQSLELIVRDAKHVQDFIGHFENRHSVVMSEKTRQTMAARESFLSRSDELLGEAVNVDS